MIRMRPVDPTTTLDPDSRLQMIHYLRTRGRYNGGPRDGELIPEGIQVPNEGGFSDPGAAGGWTTNERVLPFIPMELAVSKSSPQTQYLPGDAVPWTIKSSIAGAASGAVALGVTVTDTLPADLGFDQTCTESALPAGVTVSYNPATRVVVFSLGDRAVPADATSAQLPDLKVCTTVNPLARPGNTLTNVAKLSAPNASNAPTARTSIQLNGTGALSIQKSVDKPLVSSGQTFTWSLDWGNTSAAIDFAAPDVIDVLPWNGDSAAGSLSRRTQYSSDYQGSARLTGALPQPTYTSGGAGDVAGTWYYGTAAPATINHTAADPSNSNPADPGGRWQTAAEIQAGPGFDAVTAVRFVSAGTLMQGQLVRATVPQRATSTVLDNVYVNRARLFSASVPNQTLLSNEPYVLMPGFTLGDLIWRDNNANGVRDAGEPGIADVPVEIIDDSDAVVATTTTGATGRWSVAGLDEGRYRAHLPASAFLPGGVLAGSSMTSVGSSTSNVENEGQSNNNNPGLGLPTVTGVMSTPISFAYTRDAQGNITGGNGPLGDDVAGLADRVVPDDLTNFTLDLAMTPVPGIRIVKSTQGQDANDAPGPRVRVDDPVRWTYVVTNSGSTGLVDVAVGDDQLPVSAIDCGSGSNVVHGPLAPGDSFTCTATGAATAGQYANTGSVTGTNPDTGEQVLDLDPSHYFGVQPDVRIVKSTQGDDANAAPGPMVKIGDDVRWTYAVTNTGNADLTDLAVTDDKVAADDIDCGHGTNVVSGPLAPGDSVTCTATGTAVAGQYANTGTVVGTAPPTVDEHGEPVPGEEVTDTDPSHYQGVTPLVQIVKSTNGQDADQAPGPAIKVGGQVQWTYLVTNTGTAQLTDLVVHDDKVDDSRIDCGDGTNTVPGPLLPGDSVTCTATGVARAGRYENLGTVTAVTSTVDAEGGTTTAAVTDTNPSHYHGQTDAVRPPKGPKPPLGHLPNTGGPRLWVGVLGILFLLAGVWLVLLANRRERPRS